MHFSFRGDTKQSHRLNAIHDGQRNCECRHGYYEAPNCLSFQYHQATTIEKSGQGSGIVSREWTSRTKLATRKEPKRQRTPDSTESVHWHSPDRIVYPEAFEKFNSEDHQH